MRRVSQIGEPRTRRRFVISVFPSPRPSPSPPRHTAKLFPHAQFADDNAPCHGTLVACRTSRARCVSSPLSRSLFLTLNSRLPHYLPFHRVPPPPPSSLVAAVSRPRLPSFRALYSLGTFYVLLFCPVIIYIPGNIALPLSRGPSLLARERYDI